MIRYGCDKIFSPLEGDIFRVILGCMGVVEIFTGGLLSAPWSFRLYATAQVSLHESLPMR